VREEGARRDPGDGLTHVLVEVGEGLRGPRGLEPGLVLDGPPERVVGEGEHPAVGVVDQNDLVGAEQALADRQGADHVVGDDAPGVADDVGLPGAEAEQGVDVEPGVHARDDRETTRRLHRQGTGEVPGVPLVVGQTLVGHAHDVLQDDGRIARTIRTVRCCRGFRCCRVSVFPGCPDATTRAATGDGPRDVDRARPPGRSPRDLLRTGTCRTRVE